MSEYFVDKSECTHRTIFPGVDIHTMACQQMMLSMVDLGPGAVVEAHSEGLAGEHQPPVPHVTPGFPVRPRRHRRTLGCAERGR